jgi:hypothetical protein
VCVEARARPGVLDVGSSRGSSGVPAECRCKFLKKLMPRCRCVGREGELVDMAVAATVGAAGAGAVNIIDTGAARTSV